MAKKNMQHVLLRLHSPTFEATLCIPIMVSKQWLQPLHGGN